MKKQLDFQIWIFLLIQTLLEKQCLKFQWMKIIKVQQLNLLEKRTFIEIINNQVKILSED